MPMTDEQREVFEEVTSSSAPLSHLHPLRLDRWHRTLVDAPEPIYMQLGCQGVFQHIDQATLAIRGMIELMGLENLPLEVPEIARRHIKTFHFHVSSELEEAGTHPFLVTWDKDSSSWHLRLHGREGDELRAVNSLEQAVDKAHAWALEVDEEDAKGREAEE